MFILLEKTDLRRSDFVSLTWEQVDIINEMIRINGRTDIALRLHLIPLLASYKATLRSDQMYPKEPAFLKNPKALDPRGLHDIFKDVLKKTGLPLSRFALHQLRPTFVALMLQQNEEIVDLRTRQELLGHESITSIEVYTHVEFEQNKKAIDSFEYFDSFSFIWYAFLFLV